MSEMKVARRLKQRRQGEFALIRKFEGEPFFGVQLAGTNAEEIGWAAALVESRGADLVDLNCGCPIDHFTRKGIGATLGRQPSRNRRIVESMKQSVARVPVTVTMDRLGIHFQLPGRPASWWPYSVVRAGQDPENPAHARLERGHTGEALVVLDATFLATLES